MRTRLRVNGSLDAEFAVNATRTRLRANGSLDALHRLCEIHLLGLQPMSCMLESSRLTACAYVCVDASGVENVIVLAFAVAVVIGVW